MILAWTLAGTLVFFKCFLHLLLWSYLRAHTGYVYSTHHAEGQVDPNLAYNKTFSKRDFYFIKLAKRPKMEFFDFFIALKLSLMCYTTCKM
jgi:hypothetical protein